ncbi:ABC transporter permease subunit [Marinicellulosiphila megalodicopiae]|uniref:ABC transporter permease subunit n=1 Tax=Marinicellulosiphila megalodicopiae TaxID=2724896 RepID=UPI003BB1D080
MLKPVFLTIIFLFTSLNSYSNIDRYERIQSRGEVIIGVKNDYHPWSYVDINNQLIGYEPDLAKLIAEHLNVQLKLVMVNSSNRQAKLLDGEIDIILATMGDSENRRDQMGMITPGYYSSGVNILTNSITQWDQLYGQKICLTKDAFYNVDLIKRFNFSPLQFSDNLKSLQSLINSQCDGWIYDDTALIRILKEKPELNLTMPLNTIMVTPWVLAVRPEERTQRLGIELQNLIINWHQKNTLIELEKKWGLPETSFLKKMAIKWNSNDCILDQTGRHQYYCQGHDQPITQASNDNILFLGLNFPPLYDQFSQQQLIQGTLITFLLSISAILGSLLIGLLFSLLLLKSPKPIRWLVAGLTYIFRMTPPILNLYIVFFGIGGILASNFGISLNALWVAIIILSLYAGTSNAVMLQQAFDGNIKTTIVKAYDNLVSNSVNIVKASGIASTIAVAEIISVTKSIIVELGQGLLMMTFLLVFYYVLVSIIIFLLNQTKSWVAKWN